MLSSSKLTKLLICVVLILALNSLSGFAQEQKPNLEIANEYIRIIINTLDENMGRFSVGTTGETRTELVTNISI